MRSRTCTMEGPDDGHIQPTTGFIKEGEENNPQLTKKKMKEGKLAKKTVQRLDLSKEDLLHLLGIMEGEVQAREDIIGMLRSERTRPETLEAHYGSSAPVKPLQALQRDNLLANGSRTTDDVYERPMAELDRLEDKQRETYRRMLEQLLLAEKCHRRTVLELENEKHKHADFITKSDDFTNLLEQERERLKTLLEQEKVYQARKDKDHGRRLEKVQAELVKLRSFALMLVDERQLHMEQIEQHGQKLQDLTQKLQDKEQRLVTATNAAKEDNQKVLKLEAELEHSSGRFFQEHEEMTTKLANQESQCRQLRLKLAGLSQKMEELEESNKLLHKAEEDLQELREKISKGECGSSSVMAELETLRKKVLEMEGKDEEITKTENQCRELRKRLQDEENQSKELRLEVDKLQKRMIELEKLEGAFNKSKTECSQLHVNLEKEKRVVKDLASELETVKNRMKEVESSESKFEKAELLLKDDLMKLKSFTVMLVDERKNLAEKLKQEEQKSEDMSKMFKAEQCKVMEVTEKLIEESKKLFKLKSEMEAKVSNLTEERNQLKTQLEGEEETRKELNSKMGEMKVRMDGLVEDMERKQAAETRRVEDDNKVQELTLEIERLRSRLKHLEVVEGDLMKTEDEYDLLEKKFRTEQDKANWLCKLVEEMRAQIARNKAIERGEVRPAEAQLRIRCKIEEAKTRELQADVQALKEKIHELMNKEDQLSQLQVDYSLLQQRFLEEDVKRHRMRMEIGKLTKELETTKCYSRALRPSTSGSRMVDVPVTSTAVQTDLVAEDETTAGFIRKSVLEENHLMSNLRQCSIKKPSVLERYPPAAAELGARKAWMPWMKKKETIGVMPASPERMTMSPKPGQPLHIRVTPDHGMSRATLEITSPGPEDFFSSTAIIPTLGQKPRITIVPKPTTVASKTKASEMMGPDRAQSPVTITTISRAKTPERTHGYPGEGAKSPVSIITVSTTPVAEACASPELPETAAGRAVFKMTPDKQTQVRKYNTNTNIVTTEDNKIHIHLGSPFKRPSESRSSPLLTVRPVGVSPGGREMPTGTVLRSPRQPGMAVGRTTPSKMTSSIMITPISSTASRPTQAAPGPDIHSAQAGASRVPLPKGTISGCRASLSASAAATTLESRAESQFMKIELRKATACGSASSPGGKS